MWFDRPAAACVLVLLAAVCGAPGCGDDLDPNEGFFDRYDACERMVSLCGLTRDGLAPCVEWIVRDYPNEADRTLLVQCMQNAPDCAAMRGQCNLPDGWFP